jgi:hypothetical protein
MLDIFNRFDLQAIKFNAQTVIAAIAIWLVIVGCAISSILAQPFAKRQRQFWIAVVVCLPLIGVLAYLPFSFRTEDLPNIFLPKGKKKPRTQKESKPSAGSGRTT